jgi:uncharacterized protein (TIGR03437 family)
MRLLAVLFVLAVGAPAAGPAAYHLNYATYLGGSLDEQPAGIAVDSAGNAYIAGTTYSADFPLTSTAFGVPSKDHPCAFVTKLNAAGSGIAWSVCLANAAGAAIALDAGGSVYVLASGTVTKLTPAADRIVYSKALGASASAMAVDAAGNVYLVGTADESFAATAGAYQPALAPGTCYSTFGGHSSQAPCTDAFAMKLGTDGSVAYATYLGGSGPDQARAVAVDSQGNAWITGDTESPNFPVTASAAQSTFHGEVDLGPLKYGDAFVAKLDPTGGKLLYSTYLGGSAPDVGLAIAVDSAGAAYVAGGTQSTDFPTTAGALQRVYEGGNPIPSFAGDAFVVKFNASGLVVYSTFLGGPQDERATAIAVDPQGNVYVNAYPNTSTQIPITLSELSPDGSAILNTATVAGWFAVDSQSSVYLAGATLGNLFFPSAGAYQNKFGGGTYDVTAVKIDFVHPPTPRIATVVNAAGMRSGTPQNYPVFNVAPGEIVTIFGAGFDTGTRVLFDATPAPILYVQSDQINAVVPFGVAGPTTGITLQASAQTFGPGTMNVFDAVPALFTADGTGHGQAAILNQDETVNSAANPAARGSVISVFMTGAGRMIPAQSDGSPGPLSAPFPVPVLGAACSLGQVLYAGAAPGLVAGAVQVNVRIGQDVSPGDHVPIIVYIGNYPSGFLGDTTVAVR